MSLSDKFKQKKEQKQELKQEVKKEEQGAITKPVKAEVVKEQCDFCGKEYANVKAHMLKCASNPDNVKPEVPVLDIDTIVNKIIEKMPKQIDIAKLADDMASKIVSKYGTIEDSLQEDIKHISDNLFKQIEAKLVTVKSIVDYSIQSDAKFQFQVLYNSIRNLRNSGSAKKAVEYLKAYFNIDKKEK